MNFIERQTAIGNSPSEDDPFLNLILIRRRRLRN
jgi:hypothetical protein